MLWKLLEVEMLIMSILLVYGNFPVYFADPERQSEVGEREKNSVNRAEPD